MQQQLIPEQKRRTLFEITEDLVALGDLLEEKQGDISDEEEAAIIDQWLQENLSDLDKKVDSYVGLIKEFETEAVVKQARADSIAEQAKIAQNRANRLKGRMMKLLLQQNLQKLIGEEFTIAVHGNGGRQIIDVNEAAVPSQFKKKIEVIDYDKIRQELESGHTLPFAELQPRGKHLRIK